MRRVGDRFTEKSSMLFPLEACGLVVFSSFLLHPLLGSSNLGPAILWNWCTDWTYTLDFSHGFNRWSPAAKGRERQSYHWEFTVKIARIWEYMSTYFTEFYSSIRWHTGLSILSFHFSGMLAFKSTSDTRWHISILIAAEERYQKRFIFSMFNSMLLKML